MSDCCEKLPIEEPFPEQKVSISLLARALIVSGDPTIEEF